MTEIEKPRKKKVYAEVQAAVSFSTKTRQEAEQLAEHFLKRRGIAGTWSKLKSDGKSVELNVTYRVHGGWASDFVKKLTYDAQDLGIELSDVSVSTTRTEIPNECPRQECLPCEYAKRGETYYVSGGDTPARTKPAEPPADPSNTEPKKRRFFTF